MTKQLELMEKAQNVILLRWGHLLSVNCRVAPSQNVPRQDL